MWKVNVICFFFKSYFSKHVAFVLLSRLIGRTGGFRYLINLTKPLPFYLIVKKKLFLFISANSTRRNPVGFPQSVVVTAVHDLFPSDGGKKSIQKENNSAATLYH